MTSGEASFNIQHRNDLPFIVDLGKVNWGLPAGQNIETGSGPGHFTATEVVFSIRYMF